MKSTAQVVVIGGGVVGCSVLYHLTKAGWKDVVLVERDILTSGSTWHAAGGFHTLNGDPNVAKLQGYTIGLYDELEKISGQACGLHRSGGLMLAETKERMDWLKMAHARARYLGLECELLTVSEAKKLTSRSSRTVFPRRPARPERRPSGSQRHHLRLCQGGPHPGR
jgi:dimethylglycine dehydrogenase